MPLPTLGDVHVNRPLTMMSMGYQQEMTDFVAGNVFPEIPVSHKSDVYFKYSRADFFRNSMKKRAPSTPAEAGGYKLASAPYTIDVWALQKPIDDQIRANSDSPLNPDRDATMYLTQQALINRDVNWAAAFFQPGVWQYNIAGGTGSPSSSLFRHWNLAGSTPIDDILAGHLRVKQNTGLWPNTLVLGARTYLSLLVNPQIIDRLKYGAVTGGPVMVTTTNLEALFRVKRVLVMGGIQTTSPENMTADSDDGDDTFDFIAGDHAWLGYAADSPGLMQASAGYTFNWTGYLGATNAGTRIKKYRWEIIASDLLEIESAYGFGQVSKHLGYFFENALQS